MILIELIWIHIYDFWRKIWRRIHCFQRRKIDMFWPCRTKHVINANVLELLLFRQPQPPLGGKLRHPVPEFVVSHCPAVSVTPVNRLLALPLCLQSSVPLNFDLPECVALCAPPPSLSPTFTGAVGTRLITCQNISLYEPEQSPSLSQDEGEQCWGVP